VGWLYYNADIFIIPKYFFISPAYSDFKMQFDVHRNGNLTDVT
jgi:hypothetical protein